MADGDLSRYRIMASYVLTWILPALLPAYLVLQVGQVLQQVAPLVSLPRPVMTRDLEDATDGAHGVRQARVYVLLHLRIGGQRAPGEQRWHTVRTIITSALQLATRQVNSQILVF